MIEELGVKFHCNVEVGRDMSVADLEKKFDAVFVGVGLAGSPKLGIPGEELPEVVQALDFIAEIHKLPLHQVAVGNRVAVIGGGNTAIDAVTQAKRLGAREAVILYRRTCEDMSAYEFEQKLAKTDGAAFMFNVAPVEVLAKDGHLSGLKLARTSNTDGKVQLVPGSEFIEPFDMIIKAIGEEKQAGLLKKLFPSLELDARGVIFRDATTGQTNLPKVFTGGDCANGGKEVVNAVAEGKKAARGIHAFFANQKIEGPVQASRLGVKGGPPIGSGFDKPIRVPELEEEYFAKHDK
jgi:glutamate synthase (NADPH/NADH) small chain